MNPVMVNQDEEHLRLLAIFHYVIGGLMALFACFGLIYIVLGMFFAMAPAEAFGPNRGQQPPPFMGWLFTVMGGLIVTIGWTIAGLVLLAGRSLARRKRWVLCLVAACVECLWMPFGTVLGVFTIIVLMRSSVREAFGRPAEPS